MKRKLDKIEQEILIFYDGIDRFLLDRINELVDMVNYLSDILEEYQKEVKE